MNVSSDLFIDLIVKEAEESLWLSLTMMCISGESQWCEIHMFDLDPENNYYFVFHRDQRGSCLPVPKRPENQFLKLKQSLKASFQLYGGIQKLQMLAAFSV